MTDTAVADFLRYRLEARALFPVLGPYPLVYRTGSEISWEHFLGSMPQYNVPNGFDVNSNQQSALVGYHEPGHEYKEWLDLRDSTKAHEREFLALIGETRSWAVLKTIADMYPTPQGQHDHDPNEWWADAFADAVAGRAQVGPFVVQQVDPLRLRAFFQSFLPKVAPVTLPTPPVAQPTATLRYCFDSITPRDIPPGVEFVAGYIDGAYKWTDADWAMFPGSIKVRIAVWPTTNDGHVLDVEPGDATPESAVAWVQMRRAAGADPTIYCGLNEWAEVRGDFGAAGVPEPHWWVAHYDNDPTPIPGAIVKQYANPTFTGHHYDASVVAGRWLGVEEGNKVAFKDDPDAQAFKDDTNNTIQAIKDELAKLAHHKHSGTASTLVQTTEPQ